MNSRMRAVWEYATRHIVEGPMPYPVYMPEAITPFFKYWKFKFPNIKGSEYIAPDAEPGSIHRIEGHGSVQHEDLTKLSFKDGTFYKIICQEVFEHVPDYKAAFRECARTLADDGELIFSIPFFPNSQTTEVRATVNEDGSLNHVLPPEYHGNPMSPEGSLCFQHFGWDILDDLREAGFTEAKATQYWAPWCGHLGWDFFVFSATKRDHRD